MEYLESLWKHLDGCFLKHVVARFIASEFGYPRQTDCLFEDTPFVAERENHSVLPLQSELFFNPLQSSRLQNSSVGYKSPAELANGYN
jgi:hypothetical protein